MTYEDDRQRQVRTGQAMNLAWEYATLQGGATVEEVIQRADAAVVPIVEWINTVQARTAFTGSAQQQPQADLQGQNVPQAVPAPQTASGPFPPTPLDRTPEQGAPMQPPAATQYVGQPAPAYPQPPQPAPIPNQSQGGDWKAQQAEERYRLFFQDTTAWEDMRSQKATGQIKAGNPDFKHRSQKDQKGYRVGIWLKDAPEWAIPQLRQMGLVA